MRFGIVLWQCYKCYKFIHKQSYSLSLPLTSTSITFDVPNVPCKLYGVQRYLP